MGLASGCGSGERNFDAEGFLEEINAQGGELELGPVLTTRDDGLDVHVIKFAGDLTDSQLHSPDSGSGTMIVMGDTEAAEQEFARCDSASALTCFRAANVVLRFEEMGAADRARIFGAVEAIASKGD